jgi:hypothetical protein
MPDGRCRRDRACWKDPPLASEAVAPSIAVRDEREWFRCPRASWRLRRRSGTTAWPASRPAIPTRSVRRRHGQGDGGAWPACGHPDTRAERTRSSTLANSASRCCSRRCLAYRSAWVAYPLTRPCLPPTGTTSLVRMERAARRSPIWWLAKLISPRCHCSLDTRVIVPAQRLEDWLVAARFRTVHWLSLRPCRHRQARSWPARRPRWAPTARSTASSAVVSRSRVRTRAPAGKRTTNGSAIERMFRNLPGGSDRAWNPSPSWCGCSHLREPTPVTLRHTAHRSGTLIGNAVAAATR